jgi:hypothetical protein
MQEVKGSNPFISTTFPTCVIIVAMADPRLLPLAPGALPCVSCGYCCRRAVCPFGRWDPLRGACAHLTDDERCGRFEEIVALPVRLWWASPAFGAGCCSPLNERRRALVGREGPPASG